MSSKFFKSGYDTNVKKHQYPHERVQRKGQYEKALFYECSLMNEEFTQELLLRSNNTTFSIGTL